MGQAQVQASAPAPVAAAHSTLSKHANELKQIAALSYQAFLNSIQELNRVTHSFSDINGKNLVFQVKKDTDSTMLWKGTVRIRCHKVNSRSGSIESSRILNLKQYIHLYNEILRQAAMIDSSVPLQQARAANLDASIIFTELDAALSLSGMVDNEEEECCICMDRKAQVILTCSHMYCEQCIDEWNLQGTPIAVSKYFASFESQPPKSSAAVVASVAVSGRSVSFVVGEEAERRMLQENEEEANFCHLLQKYADVKLELLQPLPDGDDEETGSGYRAEETEDAGGDC